MNVLRDVVALVEHRAAARLMPNIRGLRAPAIPSIIRHVSPAGLHQTKGPGSLCFRWTSSRPAEISLTALPSGP
jgi:hypothetical protein